MSEEKTIMGYPYKRFAKGKYRVHTGLPTVGDVQVVRTPDGWGATDNPGGIVRGVGTTREKALTDFIVKKMAGGVI